MINLYISMSLVKIEASVTAAVWSGFLGSGWSGYWLSVVSKRG